MIDDGGGKIMFQVPGTVLEFTNAALFVVCMGIVLFIARYMIERYPRHRKTFWAWLMSTEIKLASALGLFALGDAIIRFPVWYMRHQLDRGASVLLVGSQFDAVITVGVVLCTWGGLCAVRVMAPYRMGEWPWLVVAAAALGFATWAIA
jgi:hypothetical protein